MNDNVEIDYPGALGLSRKEKEATRASIGQSRGDEDDPGAGGGREEA